MRGNFQDCPRGQEAEQIPIWKRLIIKTRGIEQGTMKIEELYLSSLIDCFIKYCDQKTISN